MKKVVNENQKSTLRKVLRYIRRYWGYLGASIILAAVTVALTLYLVMSRSTPFYKTIQKKLDKMDIIELDREKPKPEFHFKTARTSGKMIFETNDLVIGYDEPLTKPLNIRMERGERIALTGANGIGKTTLLKSILQLIKPYSGEVHLGDYRIKVYYCHDSEAVVRYAEHFDLYRRDLERISGNDTVRDPFHAGKMRSDHQTHRESGACTERRRAGKSTSLQDFEP